jgi:hypothetical protein
LSEKVDLLVFGVADPFMMRGTLVFNVKDGESKALKKLLERLALVLSRAGNLKLDGRLVNDP